MLDRSLGSEGQTDEGSLGSASFGKRATNATRIPDVVRLRSSIPEQQTVPGGSVESRAGRSFHPGMEPKVMGPAREDESVKGAAVRLHIV